MPEFLKTFFAGALTVSGLWSVGLLFSPILKKFELSWHEKVALKFSFALALCSNAFLAMSPFGLYRKTPLLVVFIALCALGIGSHVFKFRKSIENEAKRDRWNAIQLVLFLITAFGVAKAFLAALGPEFQPDALMYHLYLPKLYLSRGTVAFYEHNFTSGYGLLPQLVFGVCDALGEIEGARLVHWSFFVASLFFVYGWIKNLFDRTSALFATALLATPHMMGWCAHTANTEYFMTFFLLASARFLIFGNSLSIFVAGLLAGFACASKPIAVGFSGVAFLSFAIVNRKDLRSLFKSALMFALGVIVAYLPWSIRSFLGTGNPFYPFLARWFGKDEGLLEILGAVGKWMGHMGLGKGPFTFLLFPILLPVLFLLRPMIFGGLDPHFGWLFAYAAFFMAPAFLGRNLLRWFVFTSLLAFYLSSQQLRFLLPFYFVLAIFAASGFFKLSRTTLVKLLLLVFPIMNLYPIARHLGNVWYLDYRVPEGKYFLGKQTKDEFLARYSYSGVYQLKLLLDIFDADKSSSIFSLGGADFLYFWPREVLSSSLSPQGSQIVEKIKDKRQVDALDLIKNRGFDFLFADNVFAPLLDPLIKNNSVLPLFHTGKFSLIYIGEKGVEDFLYPEGFLPVWGILDGRPAFFAWLAKESRFIALNVKKVRLKVQIPEDVLKEGSQRLDVQIDQSDIKQFTFPSHKAYKIELEINVCDSKPHFINISAERAERFPANYSLFYYSAAISGVEIEFCDGLVMKANKKFWPLSGMRNWERIIGRTKY